MGFGILFIGVMNFLSLRIVPLDVIGFVLTYIASSRLKESEKSFAKLKGFSIFCTAYSLIYATYFFLTVFNVVPWDIVPSLVLEVERFVYYVILFVHHKIMYDAIIHISRDCEFIKGEKRAKSCLSISGVYLITNSLYLILRIIYAKSNLVENLNFGMLLNGLNAAMTLFCLMWFAYSALTVYSCYMHIATEEMLAKEQALIEKYDAKQNKYRNKK